MYMQLIYLFAVGLSAEHRSTNLSVGDYWRPAKCWTVW
jgi:hypothetical protein